MGAGNARTTGRGSGIENEGPVAILASYRDGLRPIVKDYGEDRDAALEAARLGE